jgi:cystathionine beta-lyase/cystathionine gamma-synthase
MLAARIGKTPKAMSKRPHKTETLLAHLGRAPYTDFGTVNPPVYHASTILFDSLEAYETKDRTLRQGTKTYGRMGTPTSFALEECLWWEAAVMRSSAMPPISRRESSATACSRGSASRSSTTTP